MGTVLAERQGPRSSAQQNHGVTVHKQKFGLFLNTAGVKTALLRGCVGGRGDELHSNMRSVVGESGR